MKSGKFLVDTNIIIAFLNGDQKVFRKFNEETGIFLSNISLGELYYGVERSTRKAANKAKIDTLKSEIKILDTDQRTSEIYAQIKSQLKNDGKPIPENDIWIAAQTSQFNLESPETNIFSMLKT